MAPRPKRPKLTRMDAALDAMRPMGFSDHVIRKSVRGLLKVYDGNDGWPFIEEASYMLLIQTLIDQSKEEEEQQGLQQAIVEHNGVAGEEFVHDKQMSEEGARLEHHLSEQDVVDKEVCEEDVPVREIPLLLQDENLHSPFGGRDQISSSRTPPMLDCPQTLRRCRPCYGWISDDDDEEDDDHIPVHSTPVGCRDSD